MCSRACGARARCAVGAPPLRVELDQDELRRLVVLPRLGAGDVGERDRPRLAIHLTLIISFRSLARRFERWPTQWPFRPLRRRRRMGVFFTADRSRPAWVSRADSDVGFFVAMRSPWWYLVRSRTSSIVPGVGWLLRREPRSAEDHAETGRTTFRARHCLSRICGRVASAAELMARPEKRAT